MTLFHKGSRYLIKSINRSLVLNLIKSKGPISRSQIAELSGLSPATVSGITADFVVSGLVHEMGEGESTGGRRPVPLRLNHDAGFVVGAKLMEQAITSALTDLDAKVLHHRVTPLRFAADDLFATEGCAPAVFMEAIVEAIELTISEAAVDRQRVLGIGIGLAGLVDGDAGVCRYSPFFDWEDVQLAEPIADHFGLPVYLDNDVNTLTIAEQWFGSGRNVRHFVVVTIGRGVGAGIVVNGEPYRGALGGAGELGHITVQRDGPSCYCGKTGCLEALASDPAVVRQAQAAIASGEKTGLAQMGELTIDELTEAAEAGDKLARRLLAESGCWLGVGIANLVNVLNPELVIVGGEGVRAGSWRLDPMRDAIRKNTFSGLGEDLELVIKPSGDETWARGAACVVLGELFRSPVQRGAEADLMAAVV